MKREKPEESNGKRSAKKNDAFPKERVGVKSRGDTIRTCDPLLPKQMR